MNFEIFAELNHVVLLLSLTLHCILGGYYTWILIQFLRHRRLALAAEARLLQEALPPDSELPQVLVQIPTFNEGHLVCRIAAAIGEFDWPSDRLRVQILDDSTNGSVVFGQQAVETLRQRNIDAVLLHRTNRAGFKAGALAEGLRQSDHEFIAMFDADYVPPRHFLRSCMRPLLVDRNLGLVQARCDFLNANENRVTWVQQRILDAHYAVEQAAKSWSGQIMPFNGTCGIWRRAAIEDAGGWHGDTLTEDIDLSYRAQIVGWHASFLMSVTVPGELPATLTSWRTQQIRWNKGLTEVARKMLPTVWSSQLPLCQKLVSTLHLCGGIFGPCVALTVLTGVIDLTLGVGLTLSTVLLFAFSVFEATICGQLIILFGQQQARGANLRRELIRLPIVSWVFIFVAIATYRATIEVCFSHETVFVRTPKRGS
jgi:cellulose synthase/poly-beta-1,6-N-acetylglucosamine synthase-like glycosyltransferase